MTMTLTVHGGDGEFARYAVILKPVNINRHYKAICKRIVAANEQPPGSEAVVYASVFACGVEEARAAAVDKLKDKWLRHRGWETEWTAHDAYLD